MDTDLFYNAEFYPQLTPAAMARRRSAIAESREMPKPGSDFTRLRNTLRLMASRLQSVSAAALAERGYWSTSAISPKAPPGPTRSTTAPRIEIATRPSSTMYMKAPVWPATMMILLRS